MSNVKPLKVREQVVVLLLVSHVLISGVSMWSAGLQIDLVDRMQVGDFTYDEVTANDERQMTLAAVGVGLHLITAIAFLFWFRRAYDNLAAVGRPVSTSLGGPIIAWFIPFVNFVRPFQITRQIWHLSDPVLNATEDEEGSDAIPPLAGSAPPWMTAWWGAWIGSGIIANVSVRVDDPGASAYAQLFSDLLTAGAGVLAVYLVRQISERQRSLGAGREPAVF